MERDLYLELREKYFTENYMDTRVLYEYYLLNNKKEEFSVEDIDHFNEVFQTTRPDIDPMILQLMIKRLIERVISYMDRHFNIVFLFQGNQVLKVY